MQGLWKDKKKHFVKEKFHGLYNRASRESQEKHGRRFCWASGEFSKGAVDVDVHGHGRWARTLTIKVYGVNSWHLHKLAGIRSTHKYGQKMVNGATRTLVRNWISQKDWETERKTNVYEKSLGWYFY